MASFMEMLRKKWEEKRFVCVGLNTDYAKIPAHLKNGNLSTSYIVEDFNKSIVDATKDVVAVYKLNLGFYLSRLDILHDTIGYIRQHSFVPVILDGKFGDIGNSNEQYANFAFVGMLADAVTVNPYVGGKALEPFLKHRTKGVFVLCRTSNEGSDEFQAPLVMGLRSVYEEVSHAFEYQWNGNENCGLVAGATYASDIEDIRQHAPTLPILIPGVGAQGGDLEAAVLAAVDKNGSGFIVNSSRGIIYASSADDFAEKAGEEAKKLNDEINAILAGM